MVSVEIDKSHAQAELFTIGQVSTLTKIPVATLRKYIKRYKSFIPVVRGARNVSLFSDESIRQFVVIKSLSAQRLKQAHIKEVLRGQTNDTTGQGESDSENSDPKRELVVHGQGRQQDHLSGQVQEIKQLHLDLIEVVKVIQEENHSLRQVNSALQKKADENQSRSVELLNKLWELENQVGNIQKGQGFWATIKRWMGLS